MSELNKKMAELAKTDRRKFAEIMVEYVNPGHFTEDLVSMMLDTKRLNPGDILSVKVRKGVNKVRTLVPGQMTLSTEIVVKDRANVRLDYAYIHVTANEEELRSGEIGTPQDIRREMQLSLKDNFVGRVFNALSSVWNAANTPDFYTTVAGQINATALRQAINKVYETSGGVRGVFGTRKALAPITEFGNFVTDGSNVWGVSKNIEEIMQTGWLGRWYGAPIVAFEQSYDNLEDWSAMIPDNIVLVVGEKVGKFLLYGDPRWDEWTDKRTLPPQWNLRVAQQFGMVIDWAQGLYVIEIV